MRSAAGLAALDDCLSPQAKDADRISTIIRQLISNNELARRCVALKATVSLDKFLEPGLERGNTE